MKITVKEVTGKKGIKEFVLFPFNLYKNSKNWIPPLIQDEIDSFDPQKNPVFENAIAKFFIAYKNQTAVGRIAVILNWNEIQQQHIQKVRFGWFDFIDDISVSAALLEKAFEIGKQHQLEYVEGPMGFSNMDKVGVMIEGFENLGTMATWYNYPYYSEHLEKLGFTVEKEFVESIFYLKDITQPETYEKAASLIEKRYQLRAVNFSTTQEIIPYIDEMFDLFNRSYAALPSFVAVTDKQKEYFKKKYLGMINPKLVKFIFDKEGKMVCFSVVITSFSKALQKSKGKLFPFGFYHFLKAKKNHETLLFYLIGIDPDYQKKGLIAIVFRDYYRDFVKMGTHAFIQTPQLVSNHSIQNLWRNFNAKVYVKRNTYRKNITAISE